MIKSIREQLDDRAFLGVVEDANDKKRLGRVKVRVEQLHGRLNSAQFIPTAHLPWATPDYDNTGGSFATPANGKIVNVTFLQGDIQRPIYGSVAHLNYNLQDKLNGMSDAEYAAFYAPSFDDQHQYFHDLNQGIMFDYVKSHFNMRPNGDMVLALRDNKSKLYLGSPDASEPVVLGNHWLTIFDKLVKTLMTTAFIGNIGAPCIPSPAMLEFCNEYLTNREKYISDHVFVTDDQRIKSQTRKFDKKISADKYTTEAALQPLPDNEPSGYAAAPRAPGAEVPATVPPTGYADTLSSAALPPKPKPEELAKLAKPFANALNNGDIPVAAMTVSKYLRSSFPGDDERKYLLDAPAKALDSMLDAYHAQRSKGNAIVAQKGYQNLVRQAGVSNTYPNAPATGQDPFGWANQVVLHWGVNDRLAAQVEDVRHVLEFDTYLGKDEYQDVILPLLWLKKNAAAYKFRNAGRDGKGDTQWYHWIYDPAL